MHADLKVDKKRAAQATVDHRLRFYVVQKVVHLTRRNPSRDRDFQENGGEAGIMAESPSLFPG